MARRAKRPARLATLPPLRALALLAGAGAAGGLVYNVLSPRGIFAPVPVTSDFGAPSATPAVDSTPVRHDTVPRRVEEAPATRTATGRVDPVVKAAPPRVIVLAEAESLARARAAVFVDARPPESFKLGHIPRAINVPSNDFPAAFARERGRLDPGAPTVVYCTSEDCDESDLVVEQLLKAGFTHLLHYKQGWNAWENANLPQEQ